MTLFYDPHMALTDNYTQQAYPCHDMTTKVALAHGAACIHLLSEAMSELRPPQHAAAFQAWLRRTPDVMGVSLLLLLLLLLLLHRSMSAAWPSTTA
jgi:hypothetical protein